MKTKKIEISEETQAILDNLRRELISIISQGNDNKDILKKLEKCSYERLIILLSVGFSEYSFFNAINGKFDIKEHDTVFTEGARTLLNKLLEEQNGKIKTDSGRSIK